VLTFEDLDKSTMAHVFFRIANLNSDYPNIEYPEADFIQDTDTMIDYKTGSLL